LLFKAVREALKSIGQCQDLIPAAQIVSHLRRDASEVFGDATEIFHSGLR
jgi:hypothetical protein